MTKSLFLSLFLPRKTCLPNTKSCLLLIKYSGIKTTLINIMTKIPMIVVKHFSMR